MGMLISEELMTLTVCMNTDRPPKAIKKLTNASSSLRLAEQRPILLIPLVISIIPRRNALISLGLKTISLKMV